MSNAQHTPGPWGCFLHFPEMTRHIGPIPTTYAKGDPVIADIRSNGADAALIAAAPDLLAALEEVVAQLDECEEFKLRRGLQAAKARAAIAKARDNQV